MNPGNSRTRILRAVLTITLVWVTGVAAQPAKKETAPRVARNQVAEKPGLAPVVTPEREAAALTFVKRNHSDLLGPLEQLKYTIREQYEKVIYEIFQTSESLVRLQETAPRRYELALEAWKLKSRIELLAAQLAGSRDPVREDQLRELLRKQIQIEIAIHSLEREQVQARLQKINAVIQHKKSHQDRIVEDRLQKLQRFRETKPQESQKTQKK